MDRHMPFDVSCGSQMARSGTNQLVVSPSFRDEMMNYVMMSTNKYMNLMRGEKK
jgi:hypothetical protein